LSLKTCTLALRKNPGERSRDAVRVPDDEIHKAKMVVEIVGVLMRI
jgi:hypothetical protein